MIMNNKEEVLMEDNNSDKISFKQFIEMNALFGENLITQIGLHISSFIYKTFLEKCNTNYEWIMYDNTYSYQSIFNEMFERIANGSDLVTVISSMKVYLAAISILFDENDKNGFIHLITNENQSKNLEQVLRGLEVLDHESALAIALDAC